jgi:hypothetical protein
MTLFSNRWYRRNLLLFVVLCAFCFSIGYAQSETNSEFKNEPSLTKEDEMINADEIYIELHPDEIGTFHSCYKDARELTLNTEKDFNLLFNLIDIKNQKIININYNDKKMRGKKIYFLLAFFHEGKNVKSMYFFDNEYDKNKTYIFTYYFQSELIENSISEVKKNPKILYEEIYKAFDFKTKGEHPCYLKAPE